MPQTKLQGMITDSGWYIKKLLVNKSGSGSNFGTQYLVEFTEKNKKTGEETKKIAFMKAMDLSRARTFDEINQITAQHIFEREMLEYCKEKKMSKVVVPLDAGHLLAPGYQPPYGTVTYVIFELADGNIRDAHLNVSMEKRNWVQVLKIMQHSALGIVQLHRADVSHQDIKPSNVLNFNMELFKIADLGRAVDKASQSPFSVEAFAGDPGYIPIEGKYGVLDGSFNSRLSSDMYMVGSLLFHLVTGMQITQAIISKASKIDASAVSGRVGYDDAMPVLLMAYDQVLNEFEQACTFIFNEKIAYELRGMLFSLCYPSHSERGQRKFKKSPRMQFSLESYVSKFDRLYKTAIIQGC